jgi:signal transduction histidine kinase
VWLKARAPRKAAPMLLSSTFLSGDAADGAAALQSGLDLATEGIMLLDPAGRILAANSRAHELAHSALAALPGNEFWEALPEHIAEEHRGGAEQALAAGDTHQFVAHHEFEDQWVEVLLRPHAGGVVVNLKDTSEHHRALRLLGDTEFCNQVLFDAHPDALWIFDTVKRRLLGANQAAAAFYGLPQARMAGLAVESLFPTGDAEPLPRDFQGVMRLCTQKKAGGDHVLVELDCSSLQWDGHPAVLASVVDVGAQHLADGHLRRLNEELEERVVKCTEELQRSERELEVFADAMSHDLKAPLHVVNGFARTLAERYSAVLDDQGQHFLSRIQASTRHMGKLIENLRLLLRLSHADLVPEPVDLGPAVQRLVEELRKGEPGRQVVLEMEASLPVVGDRTMLLMALSCLIDNAWKFTSKKAQGWIKVGLIPGELAGEKVLFVSDNGAGFDPAYAVKLFTAFQRLHSSADFPGSGLGLAIVKRVALRHGGQAWGETSASAGASFFMSLPDLPVAAPEEEGPEDMTHF